MRALWPVVRGALLLALLALIVPGAAVRPTTVSLSRSDTAKSVDFEEGVVWVLVLGRDAEDDTDTIEMLAFDGETGAAAGIGIPRDSYVRLPEGPDRINAAWSQGGGSEGGAELAASAVGNLVGVDPDFVLVTGFDGFLEMSEAVGEVEVRSPLAFETDQGLAVRRGPNRFDAEQALDFASSRDNLNDDFERMANNQALLLGYLRSMKAREDEKGFMEKVTLAALGGLETDLAPTDLYRLAQAVTQVDPNRVTGCLVTGTPFTADKGAQVIRADKPLAQRLGRDADRDATLNPGCRG